MAHGGHIKRIRRLTQHCWRLMAMLTLICSALASAQASPNTIPLRIITVDEAPANFVVDGQAQGYAVDLVRAIQQQLHDNTRIEVLPEDQALHIASTRPNVLLFSFSRTRNREEHFIWLLPLLRKKWQLFMPTPVASTPSIDLQRLPTIAVVRGDVREEQLRSSGLKNLVTASSTRQALELLQQQRVSALASSQMEIDLLWHQYEFPGSKPAAVLAFGYADSYLLFSKQTDPALLQQWQKAISQLRQQGLLRKTAIRWQAKLSLYSGQPPRLLPGDWLEY